ncbi:hypothetical protein V8F20_002310 [Naviculisporaceae sp. PSN 640]
MDKPAARDPSRPRWRTSALLFSGFGFVVFGVNLGAAIWATRNSDKGIAMVTDSNCATVKTQNMVIHLLINVLSSILLSGSNYCMQCLMGPTRQTIDKVHARKKWLDIGLLSFRNFGSMGKVDKMFWLMICISSLPLHLFYNSVVFSSSSVSEYQAWYATEDYLSLLDSTSLDNATFYGNDGDWFPWWNSTSPHLNRAYKQGRLTRLSVEECIDGYTKPMQSNWNDLFVVLDGPSPARGLIGNADINQGTATCSNLAETFQWVCEGFGDERIAMGNKDCQVPCEDRLPSIRASSSASWTFEERKALYCLSMKGQERCKIRASSALLWLVAGTSLVKAVLFSIFAIRVRDERILTVGDAISTFLEHPDPITEGACLLTMQEVVTGTGPIKLSKNERALDRTKQRADIQVSKERVFMDTRKRGFAAATGSRWCIYIMLYILSLSLCLGLLGYGFNQLKGPLKTSTMFSWGLAPMVSRAAIVWETPVEAHAHDGAPAFIALSVIANAPQILVSLVYFTCNGLFTSISTAREWARFAHQRKGLRVSSDPVGAQRSQYFLQLPFRFSIPLIILSSVTHWLVGQSFYLFSVDVYTTVPRDNENFGKLWDEPAWVPSVSPVTTGWSPLGLVLTALAGTLMIVCLLITAWRKLPSGMPVVGNCSLAMSAACHTIPFEPDAWKKKVSWGVVPREEGNSAEPLHCSFTSRLDVEYPTEGEFYE